MMLTVVHGPPGNGKGVYAVMSMEVALFSGRRVATNIDLTPQCPWRKYVAPLNDEDVFDENTGKGFWDRCDPGQLIVIDEVDNFFDAADFAKLRAATAARLYFKQHRKRGDDLLLITQDLENLWVRIRRMAQQHVMCEYTWLSRPLLQKFPRSFSRFIFAAHTGLAWSDKTSLGYGGLSYAQATRFFSYYKSFQFVGGASCLEKR